MAKILSLAECCNDDCVANCPYPSHPDECGNDNCLTCPTHCPCCDGCNDGVCNQCPEEDCGNRNAPYDPSSVSQKEE